jgi:prevent-host-death family protein
MRPVQFLEMTIYNPEMDISVTEFKHRCLELIRDLEKTGRPITITRRGKTVARLVAPAAPAADDSMKPWERLRALGGQYHGEPGESMLRDEDFDALR